MSKPLGIIPSIGAVLTFLLTQNMGASMVLADKWTAPMTVIAAISAGLICLTKNKKSKQGGKGKHCESWIEKTIQAAFQFIYW